MKCPQVLLEWGSTTPDQKNSLRDGAELWYLCLFRLHDGLPYYRVAPVVRLILRKGCLVATTGCADSLPKSIRKSGGSFRAVENCLFPSILEFRYGSASPFCSWKNMKRFECDSLWTCEKYKEAKRKSFRSGRSLVGRVRNGLRADDN